MSDAKEPAVIAALRKVVHPTRVGTVPIVYADILQAWDTLTRERDEAAHLLAVIHRDGGHYTGSVGFALSCADAEAAVLRDRTKRDEIDEACVVLNETVIELRTQLAAARVSLQAMELSRDKRLERARSTIAFFASVIKSGEPWTTSCEEALTAALSEAT
jgi:hypothetical protein